MATGRDQVEFNLLGEKFLGQMFILGALGAALFGVFQILAPYIHSIVLAALVAYVLRPLYNRIHQRVRRPNVAAFLSCMVVALLIMVPAVIFVGVLANKGTVVWQQATAYVQDGRLQEDLKFERLKTWREKPLIKRLVDLWEEHGPKIEIDKQKIGEFIVSRANEWARKLAPGVGAVVGNVLSGFLNFLLMFFVMFYFFRDGEKMLNYLLGLVPLSAEHERRLVERVEAVSRSAVLGTLATAAVQGALAMVGFAVVGVPWLFWGFVTGFAAMVPVVGAALVWVPAAIWLLLNGQIWQGIVLVVWGGVIGLSDNVLRPYFMKGDTGMSSVIAFFAILGGIQLFGLLGVVYGPLIVGVCAVLIYIFRLEKEASRAETGAGLAAPGDYYANEDGHAGE